MVTPSGVGMMVDGDGTAAAAAQEVFPAPAPTDLQAFMQIMHQQPQQVQALLLALANTTGASTHGHQPGVVEPQAGLDERRFRRLEKFANKRSKWRERRD